MENRKILRFLHVLAWIFFIGMCVEAGSFLFNMIYTLAFQPLAADYLPLTDLLRFGKTYFALMLSLMTVAAVLKTLALYRIVMIFTENKLDLRTPFNVEFGRFVFSLSYLTLAIGIVSVIGAKTARWIADQNVFLPDLGILRLAGADVWLFMGATLYVIGLIFHRGVEMQSESELTI
ncbi:DUF2975 domain-containing protein [Flavobacterium selenitireducens]|uniref:DUF2975 domain-containing protein n=1 Tax=Flavobacterium selenitireducens TaxID=2722704 RepID=UPI00168A7C93|nr:DUF2975 domain-containing protein [Flavobacterium selenitireducens]MBD3583683.1 DUF2975 domain-containing protein [Flavobacterium selenitireducens]